MTAGPTPAPVVTATIEVAVDPATAFEAFTTEAGAWYVDGPHSWNDPDRAKELRIEGGMGGRVVEVHDLATGDGYEWGRISVWEPPRRLAFSFRSVSVEPGTEVEVRFEPTEGGTRVTLEHRGWEHLSAAAVARGQENAPYGWRVLLGWFADHIHHKETS